MKKRFLAFIIDIILVTVLCLIICNLMANKETKILNNKLDIITDQVLSNEISNKNYLSDYFYINYKIDKINIVSEMISFFIIIFYFIIVPVYTKGQTLGLKLMKLKIKGKVSIQNMFRRNIITIGLLIYIAKIILIYVLNYKMYYIIMFILLFIQLLLVIISTFMILYNEDKKGLQDKLSSTYIEEV